MNNNYKQFIKEPTATDRLKLEWDKFHSSKYILSEKFKLITYQEFCKYMKQHGFKKSNAIALRKGKKCKIDKLQDFTIRKIMSFEKAHRKHIGYTTGKIIIVAYGGYDIVLQSNNTIKGTTYSIVTCECGNLARKKTTDIVSNKLKSCGCGKTTLRVTDILGKINEPPKVVSELPPKEHSMADAIKEITLAKSSRVNNPIQPIELLYSTEVTPKLMTKSEVINILAISKPLFELLCREPAFPKCKMICGQPRYYNLEIYRYINIL